MRGQPAERRGCPSWERVLRRGPGDTPRSAPACAPSPANAVRLVSRRERPPVSLSRSSAACEATVRNAVLAAQPVLCPAAQPSLTRLPGVLLAWARGLPAVPWAPASPALRRRLLRAGGCCCPKPLAVVSKCGLVISGGRRGLRATLEAQGRRCRSWSGARPTARGLGSDPRSPIRAASRWAGTPPASARGRPHCLCGPSQPARRAQPFSPAHVGLGSLRRKSLLPCSEQTLVWNISSLPLYRHGSAWADRGPRTVSAFSSVPHGQVRPTKSVGLHGRSVCAPHSSSPAGVTSRTPCCGAAHGPEHSRPLHAYRSLCGRLPGHPGGDGWGDHEWHSSAR